MFNNPYEAPQELATGGHVTKELSSVTVHFDDIHYALSSGPTQWWVSPYVSRTKSTINIPNRNRKDLPGGSVANYLVKNSNISIHQFILVQRFLRLLQ